MKAIYRILTVGVTALFALTSCLPVGTFNPFLGGSAETEGTTDTESDLIDAVNESESASRAESGSPFLLAGATVPSGTLSNETGQIILLTFTNGVVDLDAAGQIPGLSVYPLTDTGVANQPYVRGTVLSYTVNRITTAAGSQAYLTLNLSGVPTNTIEVAAAPTLSANNGTKLINQDEDDVMGEPEDAEFFYLDVTAAPPLPAPVGTIRAPRLGVDPNFATPLVPVGFAAASTAITIAGFDVDGEGVADVFTAGSIGAGITLWKLDPALGTWSAVAEGARSYDASDLNNGVLTIPVSTAMANGDIYQVRYDRYNITTLQEVFGYIQRDYYEQNDTANNLTRTNLQVIGGAGQYATVTNATGTRVAGAQSYVTVTFGGGAATGDIVTSSITPQSVLIFYNDGTGLREVGWDFYAVTVFTDGANQIRFFLPPSVKPNPGQGFRVVVKTSVMADSQTPADTGDDVPVLALTEKLYGLSIRNGNF